MSVRKVRVRVPLTSAKSAWNDGAIRRCIESLKNITVNKPGRTLGAVHTDNKVGRGRPVTMCEDCWRRYRGWWKGANYKPDWGFRYVGDCDGCDKQNVWITLFMPEVEFYNSLTHLHGRNPQPGG